MQINLDSGEPKQWYGASHPSLLIVFVLVIVIAFVIGSFEGPFQRPTIEHVWGMSCKQASAQFRAFDPWNAGVFISRFWRLAEISHH
ncbi:MAG TPA: hypothetical protein VJ719_08425 [Chthoniobacterales bacterium]|nr:hypothetical protein [Chthoniobacterales bacterium]